MTDTSWYYSDNGKRVGPLPRAEVSDLISSKRLSPDTMVWQSGMPEWVRILDSELAYSTGIESPPPLPDKVISNGYAWALTFAPVWGAILIHVGVMLYYSDNGTFTFFGTIKALKTIADLWYLPWVINVILCFIDEHMLKKAGWDAKGLGFWAACLIPAYIYRRDRMVGASMVRFWLWWGAFVVSLTI